MASINPQILNRRRNAIEKIRPLKTLKKRHLLQHEPTVKLHDLTCFRLCSTPCRRVSHAWVHSYDGQSCNSGIRLFFVFFNLILQLKSTVILSTRIFWVKLNLVYHKSEGSTVICTPLFNQKNFKKSLLNLTFYPLRN